MTKRYSQAIRRPRTFAELEELVKERGDGRKELIKHLIALVRAIDENCSDQIIWGVAFGAPIFNLVDDGLRDWGNVNLDLIRLLFVALSDDTNDTQKILAEKIFGPLLVDQNWFPDYLVWTRGHLNIAQGEKNDVWRQVAAYGLTFYGEPIRR